MNKSTNLQPDQFGQEPSGQWYRAVWRWHFYAALLVIPVILILAVSGLLMLISKPIEPLLHQELTTVEPATNPLPASTLLTAVRAHYPNGAVTLYLPPRAADQSARFSVTDATGHAGHHAPSTTVYLNPYSGEILGTLDPAKTLYARLQNFHGTLLLGDIGDSVIEVTAGFAVLMVLTGLYLAWPGKSWQRPTSQQQEPDREKWRRFHRLTGLLIAIPLLFFLVSGLAWTNVWGGKLVQPWSSLPGTNYIAGQFEQTHQSMQQTGINPIPWALEQTPMPVSEAGAGNYDLDALVAFAQKQGFSHYRVHLPQSDTGVWTISATTIAGDLTNPLDERILHVDQSTGSVLAEITYADYPAMGKAMAAFIPLHQGDLGLLNWLLNMALVMVVIMLIGTGVTLWWQRRPTKVLRLAPPPASHYASKKVIALVLIVACCFPLSAAILALFIMVDWMLISRLAWLRRAIK